MTTTAAKTKTTTTPSAGAELRIYGRTLTLTVQHRDGGARYVFAGGPSGEHTLSADPAHTDAERLGAHWAAYVESARDAAADYNHDNSIGRHDHWSVAKVAEVTIASEDLAKAIDTHNMGSSQKDPRLTKVRAEVFIGRQGWFTVTRGQSDHGNAKKCKTHATREAAEAHAHQWIARRFRVPAA